VIVRLGADLVRAILGVEQNAKMTHHPGTFRRENPAKEVTSLVPPWLSDMAAGGSILVISDDDYADIPFEVKEFVEVLKR
jgi:hypothetical protein